VKAWREAADKLNQAATKLIAERRSDIDAAVKQMKADASEAEARLQKLKEAGRESWAALSAALAESRKAFDRANQASWDAKASRSSKNVSGAARSSLLRISHELWWRLN
jgi:hypothetical protein